MKLSKNYDTFKTEKVTIDQSTKRLPTPNPEVKIPEVELKVPEITMNAFSNTNMEESPHFDKLQENQLLGTVHLLILLKN